MNVDRRMSWKVTDGRMRCLVWYDLLFLDARDQRLSKVPDLTMLRSND